MANQITNTGKLTQIDPIQRNAFLFAQPLLLMLDLKSPVSRLTAVNPIN